MNKDATFLMMALMTVLQPSELLSFLLRCTAHDFQGQQFTEPSFVSSCLQKRTMMQREAIPVSVITLTVLASWGRPGVRPGQKLS